MEGYHEVVKPVVEIATGLRDRVVNWVLPPSVISEAFNSLQEESAKRTVEMFTQGRLFEE